MTGPATGTETGTDAVGIATAVPGVYRGYRRALVVAAVLAIATFVALAVIGEPLIGALVLAGFVLGAWNSWRVTESAPKVTAGGTVNVKALGVSGLRRLGYITLVVIAAALAFHPVGWTIVIGLAAFQMVLLAATAGPLMREVNRG